MNGHSGKIRVFVALDLPPSIKEYLSETMTRLRASLPGGVRWVDPAGVHLTLKFLGDVDAGLVTGLLQAMDESAAKFARPDLQLQLAKLGTFPNQREPRVLWAGVSGDMEGLEQLQRLVDGAISDLGFAPERRPFRPHLTLGRVRDQVWAEDRRRIGTGLSQLPFNPSQLWKVEEMHLIRSTLTPRGAIYESIGCVPFPATRKDG